MKSGSSVKTCLSCNESLNKKFFHKHIGSHAPSDGYHSYCKSCRNEKNRGYVLSEEQKLNKRKYMEENSKKIKLQKRLYSERKIMERLSIGIMDGIGLTTKICSLCKANMNRGEFFNKDITKYDGYKSRCKNCIKKYYIKNKDKKLPISLIKI